MSQSRRPWQVRFIVAPSRPFKAAQMGRRRPGGRPITPPPRSTVAAITISIMLATIMQAIDTTIANVALPHIQGSLSAAQDQITWIPDLLHRRRGDHDPADRLACRRVWHQGRLSDLGRRLHPGLGAVRHGPEPPPDGALSLAAGNLRSSIDAAVASCVAAHQSTRAARPSDGDMGHRRHARANRWPRSRRLADRQLQLALGVLHQLTDRHRSLPGHSCFHS